MKITSYTLEELKNAATRRAILGELTVFTEEGLLGLLENPRAVGDDVLLFLARDQDRVVGTLAMIPDTLFWQGERVRLAWTHKWAASAGKAGGAGALLFLTAARVYQDRIGVSGCTDMAEKIFRSSRKLVDLRIKIGASLYLRTNAAKVVPDKYPEAAVARPLLRAGDRVADLALSAWTWWWRRRRGAAPRVTTTPLPRIDPETARFIEEVRRPELFQRGAAELNWIMRSLKEPGRDDRFLTVHAEGGRLIGFLFLSLREGTMTVPYSFCRVEDLDKVTLAILDACEAYGARDLLVYDGAIVAAAARLGFPVLYQRPRRKVFLLSKRYAKEDLSSYFVHDGDGDAFF